MSEYPTSSVNYQLTTIKEGITPTICVINGFMSESSCDVNDWLSIVEVLYPNNRVVHFDWPAGNLKNMVTGDGLTFGLNENPRAKKLALADRFIKTNPSLVIASTLIDKIAGRWQKSLINAENAGEHLASILNTSDSSFVLMGHSLGARVIYNALKKSTNSSAVESAILLGGAVTHDGEWDEIMQRNPKLWICNGYSHYDTVLSVLYKIGTLFANKPIGLTVIRSSTHNHLYNFNMSEYVSGHTKYKTTTIGNFLAWRFSQIQDMQSLAKQFNINKQQQAELELAIDKSREDFSLSIDALESAQATSLDAINKI